MISADNSRYEGQGTTGTAAVSGEGRAVFGPLMLNGTMCSRLSAGAVVSPTCSLCKTSTKFLDTVLLAKPSHVASRLDVIRCIFFFLKSALTVFLPVVHIVGAPNLRFLSLRPLQTPPAALAFDF